LSVLRTTTLRECSAQQALAELPKTNPAKALEDVHDWIV
jgi:hypothetical protein